MKARGFLGGLVCGAAVTVAAPLIVFGSFGDSNSTTTTCGQGTLVQAVHITSTTTDLSPEQRDNANRTIGIGVARGLSQYDIRVALVTEMQESNLRNLPYGDRDSLGLFQQRPSQGWGTPDQVMNPDYAINKFYDVLVKVPNREGQRETAVAQAVQRSGFPDAYQKWVPDANTIMRSSNMAQIVRSNPAIQNVVSQACIGNSKVANQASGSWRIPLDPGYQVSSGYGYRTSPVTGKSELHNGQDMAAPEGTPIHAAGSGTLVEVRPAPGGGWGNTVVIDHGGGIRSRYAHMVRFADGVHEGMHVNEGDVIGYVGTTGVSTGDHLHFTIYINCQGSNSNSCDTTDPVPFMASKGLKFYGSWI